jgi:hypothetical protein
MPTHVDQLGRQRDGLNCRRDHLGRVRDKSDYGTIVIRINVSIQDAGSFNAGNRLAQPRDRFFVAALAEVWYTLNKIADWRLAIGDWMSR